jgi:hypothetical protein
MIWLFIYFDFRLFAGVMVIVRAIGPKVSGFKPGREQCIFKGDKKSRSRNSFGGEVKPSAPCRKILWHVKNPSKY